MKIDVMLEGQSWYYAVDFSSRVGKGKITNKIRFDYWKKRV